MINETRETILNKALKLFSQRGYESVGVQEVALAAAVSKPTLYHYFKSKSGLLATLLEERFMPLLVKMENLQLVGDLHRDLEQCAGCMFDFAVNTSESYRLFLCLMFSSPESEQFRLALTSARRQHLAVERVIRNAPFLHGEWRDRLSLYAATFQGLVHNYITLFLQGYMPLDDQAAHRVAGQFLYGVSNQGISSQL